MRAPCALLVSLALGAPIAARTPAAQTPAAQAPELRFSGVSANVAEPGRNVHIRIFKWSDERERQPMIAAMDPPPAPAPGGDAAAGRAARAGGGGRGGRGGRGRAAAPAAPLTPAQALAGAIRRAPTVGYIWTSDVTGYSIKYAYRAPLPEGRERIVLAIDRRLGTHVAAWQPVTTQPATDYPFTVLEMRFDAGGLGEGRSSLTTNVILDKQAGTLALENYAGAPPILQKVRKTS
jgi:hypothetical protein